MTSKSFKQMIQAGEIKRADAMKVRLEDIHIEPGFNLRDKEAVDQDGVSFEDSIALLADYIAECGQVPPLEVRPRSEGGVWIVEGERRTLAYRKLDAEGRLVRGTDGEFWIPVVPFTGNDAARTARIITSNANRKLTDLERAKGCQRLAAFGWSTDEIAKHIGMTRQRVDQLLVLANAPSAVQQAIKAGEVSGAVAVELVRKHGEEADKALAEELDKAKAQGKGKVTAGTIKGPSVPRGLLDDLHSTSIKLHSSLSMDDRLQIKRYHAGEIAEGSVQVSLQHLMELDLILEEAQRVLADKELKAQEKANKARQLELQEGGE